MFWLEELVLGALLFFFFDISALSIRGGGLIALLAVFKASVCATLCFSVR